MLLLVPPAHPRAFGLALPLPGRFPPQASLQTVPTSARCPCSGTGLLSLALCALLLLSSVRRHLPVSPPLLPPGIRASEPGLASLSQSRSGWTMPHRVLGARPHAFTLSPRDQIQTAALSLERGWKLVFYGSRASHGKSCLTPSELLRVCGLLTGTWGEAWQPACTCACLSYCPEAWPVGNHSGPAARAFSAAPTVPGTLGPRAGRARKVSTAGGNCSLGTRPTSPGALSLLGGVCSVQQVWQGQPVSVALWQTSPSLVLSLLPELPGVQPKDSGVH